MIELNGKAAIVTGAGRGIGRATAIELSRLGAAVVLASRSKNNVKPVAEAIESMGGQAGVMACDVTATTVSAKARFGGLAKSLNQP